MIRTTPFHPRLSELNDQGLYTHWQGTLSPLRYTHAPKHEYFAVRNSVGIFDTSPLFKYRVTGIDAERLLSQALVRDIRQCRPGQAHYTAWCDDRGFVMEDGVVFRHSETDFLLTSARPSLGWFADLGRRMRVELEDVSDGYGMLAVQGPRSRAVLAALMPEAEKLAYFDHVPAKVAGAAVTLSRTGYTGDLGYEIWIPERRALAVWDASSRRAGLRAPAVRHLGDGCRADRGRAHHARRRLHAGAQGAHRRAGELAVRDRPRLGRAFKKGAFVGQEGACEEKARGRRSRSSAIDHVVHAARSTRLAPRAGLRRPWRRRVPNRLVPRERREQVGYATCGAWSPTVKKYLALAQVAPRRAAGRRLSIDFMVDAHAAAVATHREPPVLQPPAKEGLMQRYDAIVIGGGHNGLSTPRTSRAPARRSWSSSGATSSAARPSPRRFTPGFKFLTGSYLISLLRPDVSRARAAAPRARDHAARVDVRAARERRLLRGVAGPRPDARRDRAAPARDADAYARYAATMRRLALHVKPLLDMAPPNPASNDPRTSPRWRGCRSTCVRCAARLRSARAVDDDERGRLPRRVVRGRRAQGHQVHERDHRHVPGRAALAGHRATCCSTITSATSTACSGPGASRAAAPAR